MKVEVLVSIILSFRPSLSERTAENWAREVVISSKRHNVDPELTAAVIQRESSWRPYVVSKSCAVGLGQVLVKPCRPKKILHLKRPIFNIRATAKSIAEHRNRCLRRDAKFKKNHCRPHWIAAYNPHKPGYAARVLADKAKVTAIGRGLVDRPRNVRVAHISDPQYGLSGQAGILKQERRLRKALRRAVELGSDFIVVTGDLAISRPYTARRRSQVAAISAEIARASEHVPVLVVPGNRDVGEVPTPASLQRWLVDFGPGFYLVKVQGVTVLAMDTSLMRHPEGAWRYDRMQREMLHKALRGGVDLIISHHPPFVDKPREGSTHWNLPRRVRTFTLTFAHMSGAKAWLCGHTRIPDLKWLSRYLLLATAGSATSPRGGSKPGLAIVDLKTNSTRWQWIEID